MKPLANYIRRSQVRVAATGSEPATLSFLGSSIIPVWVRPVRQAVALRQSRRTDHVPPGSPFIPANPQMRSSVRRRAQSPMDRLPFFFSFESVLPEERPGRLSGRRRRRLTRLPQKPLDLRSNIVQNGPAWSCVTPRRHRVKSGKDWPV